MAETAAPRITDQHPREFAESIIKGAVDGGQITADGAAARAAELLPTFSKGTAPLDPNTGQPIIPKDQSKPPSFTDGEKPIPPTQEAAIAAPPAGTPAAEPAPNAAPAESKPQAQEGAQAAEAAAAQLVDDYEEFEFEDPDLSTKFKIKAPKQYLEIAKRGYGRRTTYDRAVSFLKNADPALRPLIEDGRMNRILPLLQRALEDEAFGNYVFDGYNRSTKGLPLVEQAVREIQAQTPPATEPGFDPSLDPFGVNEQLKPVLSQFEQLNQKFQTWEQQQATQTQQQQETARRQQAWQANMKGGHEELASMYPDMFDARRGDQDSGYLRAYQCAQDAGYFQRYADPKAALVFGGQLAAQMEAERRAATQSPTAAALAAVDTALLGAAHTEAASAARAVSGGGAASAPLTAPPAKPATTNPDGTLKSREQYMAETLDWEQRYGRLKPA